MTPRIEELVAQMRTITILRGPSELDIIHSVFIDRAMPLEFSSSGSGPWIFLKRPTIVPLEAEHHYVLFANKDLEKRSNEQYVVAYDAKKRLGSMVETVYREEALDLVAELGEVECPFDSTSPFDGVVLRVLRTDEASSMSYDQLRRKSRVRRGLPDILLGLEREGLINCLRKGGKIERVVLIDS